MKSHWSKRLSRSTDLSLIAVIIESIIWSVQHHFRGIFTFSADVSDITWPPSELMIGPEGRRQSANKVTRLSVIGPGRRVCGRSLGWRARTHSSAGVVPSAETTRLRVACFIFPSSSLSFPAQEGPRDIFGLNLPFVPVFNILKFSLLLPKHFKQLRVFSVSRSYSRQRGKACEAARSHINHQWSFLFVYMIGINSLSLQRWCHTGSYWSLKQSSRVEASPARLRQWSGVVLAERFWD